MRFLKILLLFSILILMDSCNLKPRSWWKEGVIGVMADSTDWEALQGSLRGSFERVIRTPQIEKTYTLKYTPSSDFQRYTSFRYLVLTATLESKGKIGKIVGKFSDPSVREGVEKGDYFVFTQRNQWAKDQIMVILIAKDLPMLRQKIEDNASLLYDIFDRDFKRRLKKEMFEYGEQKEEEKELMDLYGWNIRIQHDYFRIQEDPEEGFVFFRRLYPERWIFVRWIDGGDTSMLNPKWVVGERNRIGATYFGGSRVSDKYLYSYRSTFLDRMAQITSGLWESDNPVAGGPFKNYTFYDPLSRRVYVIDLAVFAPGKDKVPFLRRMEIIAHTFQTIFDKLEE